MRIVCTSNALAARMPCTQLALQLRQPVINKLVLQQKDIQRELSEAQEYSMSMDEGLDKALNEKLATINARWGLALISVSTGWDNACRLNIGMLAI